MILIGIGLAVNVLIFIGYLLGGADALVGVGLVVLAVYGFLYLDYLLGGAPVVGDSDGGEE